MVSRKTILERRSERNAAVSEPVHMIKEMGARLSLACDQVHVVTDGQLVRHV